MTTLNEKNTHAVRPLFEVIKVDLRSVDLGQPFFPLHAGEGSTFVEDIELLHKACKREKQMLAACFEGHKSRGGAVTKDIRQQRREYLRSVDCLVANVLAASLRRPIPHRNSPRQVLEQSRRCQVLKDLSEPVRVHVVEKPSGGQRTLMDFGPIARGAQRMCSKLIDGDFTRQPFQFPGQGHVAKVEHALQLIEKGGFTHVSELDIANHYDTFAREKLQRGLQLPRKAIEHIVCAESATLVYPEGTETSTALENPFPPGLPQGGPVSGTIADWSVSHLDIALGPDQALINHADNFFLFAKSAEALDAGRDALSLAIAKLPGGNFKTKCRAHGPCSGGFTMLGYDIVVHGGKPYVEQSPDKAADFAKRFITRWWRATQAFNKAAAHHSKALRLLAVIELNVLRAMLAGWREVQAITSSKIDPYEAEMSAMIARLGSTFAVTPEEIAACSDPYVRYGMSHDFSG